MADSAAAMVAPVAVVAGKIASRPRLNQKTALRFHAARRSFFWGVCPQGFGIRFFGVCPQVFGIDFQLGLMTYCPRRVSAKAALTRVDEAWHSQRRDPGDEQ